MIEKLLVRVRSWLHIDAAGASVSASGESALMPALARRSSGRGGKDNGNSKLPASDAMATPPPLPGEAFSLTMEAQPESGMVITESGIIIIDPNAIDADGDVKASTNTNKGVPAEAAWALPSFANATGKPPAATARTDLSSDWDSVLARARERLSPPATPDAARAAAGPANKPKPRT